MSYSKAKSSGTGFTQGTFWPRVLGIATVSALLLAQRPLGAAPQVGPRAPAELIPEGSRFFLELDLGTLRDKGPTDAVRRVISTLAPLTSESGLSAERLRSVVMASADEPMSGDKLPSWLLFAQDGAAPSLSRLEAAFHRYTRAALKPATTHGIAYRGNTELSLLQLPGGPTLVAGASGPGAIVAAWRGGSGPAAAPLVHSSRAELLQRAAGERPTAFRVWLTLTSVMQRSLVDDAHVPAAPLEVASALRLLPDRSAELGVLARCSDEETAKKLATWLSSRLAVLAASSEVQLLGLTRYVQASKVASEGLVARLQLSLSAEELAGLLERTVGVMGTLAPRVPEKSADQPDGKPDAQASQAGAGKKAAATPAAARPARAKPPHP